MPPALGVSCSTPSLFAVFGDLIRFDVLKRDVQGWEGEDGKAKGEPPKDRQCRCPRCLTFVAIRKPPPKETCVQAITS